jgi:diguanylate cyclase (GGDEF)-like protein
VLFLDLDRFKLVNDSYGHAVGDELLSAVAGRIRASVRDRDTVARLGGDEFALVLADIGAPVDAMEVAERLIGAIDEPFSLAGRELHIGASIGIALTESGSDDDPEELLRSADTAMYRAKQELMSCYELFEPGMRSAVVERIELEADLRRAIEQEAFSLAYQPIVEVASGKLVGFEALARWIDSERGFVSPVDFIPLAEETGLILPLGRWVTRTACEQLAAWRREHDCPDLIMSINISGVQLGAHGFLQETPRIVEESGLQPRDVMLEITETVLMQNTDAALARLHALRALGFHLAVDDFGTGYSSLRYVRSFPVDILKVAKDFIDGVANDDGEQAVAAAIVQLGHSLDLRLIAEGIEDEAQQHALAALNCELGQGYHFARPMDPVAAGEWIAEASLSAA